MKTDPLFYELFQAAPQTCFELVQITPTCPGVPHWVGLHLTVKGYAQRWIVVESQLGLDQSRCEL